MQYQPGRDTVGRQWEKPVQASYVPPPLRAAQKHVRVSAQRSPCKIQRLLRVFPRAGGRGTPIASTDTVVAIQDSPGSSEIPSFLQSTIQWNLVPSYTSSPLSAMVHSKSQDLRRQPRASPSNKTLYKQPAVKTG
jgi:hypothetical protein